MTAVKVECLEKAVISFSVKLQCTRSTQTGMQTHEFKQSVHEEEGLSLCQD